MLTADNQPTFCPTCDNKGNFVGPISEDSLVVSFEEAFDVNYTGTDELVTGYHAAAVWAVDEDGMTTRKAFMGQKIGNRHILSIERVGVPTDQESTDLRRDISQVLRRRIGACTGLCEVCPAVNSAVIERVYREKITAVRSPLTKPSEG